MTKIKYFELGDVVYNSTFGKGLVYCIKHEDLLPIWVEFSSGLKKPFTFDGRVGEDQPVCLSKNPIPEIINEPIYSFNEGDLVWVRQRPTDDWVVRIFCKIADIKKNYMCYDGGRYGGSSLTDWNECKPYNEETKQNYKK